MSLTNRSSNFYQFAQYYMPAQNHTFFADNVPFSKFQTPDFEYIFTLNDARSDGTGINFREIIFSFAALAEEATIEISGMTQFGNEIDIINVSALSIGAASNLNFSTLKYIKFNNFDPNDVVNIGFGIGETPWYTPMFYNQVHQVISDGDANWTVEATLEGNWFQRKSLLDPPGELFPFNLNASLTNQTTSTTTPVFSNMPAGGMRMKYNSGDGNIRWRVGNNMYM